MQRSSTIKTARIAHRYLGVFFAPSILFFALSGVLQVLGWHQASRGTNEAPPRWMQEMGQIHKKQTWELPAPKRQKPANELQEDEQTPKKPSQASASITVLKVFVLVMSIALMVTTLLGILMAFLYGGDWRVAFALVLAGVLIPLAIASL